MNHKTGLYEKVYLISKWSIILLNGFSCIGSLGPSSFFSPVFFSFALLCWFLLCIYVNVQLYFTLMFVCFVICFCCGVTRIMWVYCLVFLISSLKKKTASVNVHFLCQWWTHFFFFKFTDSILVKFPCL